MSAVPSPGFVPRPGTSHLPHRPPQEVRFNAGTALPAIAVRADPSAQRPTTTGSARTIRVARRIKPGETIKSEAAPNVQLHLKQAYRGDPEPDEPLPEGLVSGAPTRPRFDAHGALVPHTLLGSTREFMEESARRQAAGDAAALPGGGLLGDGFGASFDPSQMGGALSDAAPSSAVPSAWRKKGVRRAVTISAWLTTEERAVEQRQRATDRAALLQREQERQKEHLMRVTGKSGDTSLMDRVAEHREKMLEREAGQGISEEDAAGMNSWQMALRGAGEQLIMIGNVMNGLYVHKRPLGSSASIRKASPPKSSERGESRGSLDWAAAGEADADAARAVSAPGGLRAPVTAAAARSGTLESVMEDVGGSPERPTTSGPAFSQPHLAGAEPVATGAPGGAVDADASYSRSGSWGGASVDSMGFGTVSLQLSHERVALEAPVGRTCTEIVTLTNGGQSAVHFTWRRLGRAELLQLAERLPSHEASSLFAVSQPQGSVEPGASVRFAFSFRSDAPGRYVSAFELLVTPDALRPVLTLTAAIAEPTHALGERRRALNSALQRSAVSQMVVDLISSAVLSQIPPPPPPPPAYAGGVMGVAERERSERWGRANQPHCLAYSRDAAVELADVAQAVGAAEAEQCDVLAVHAAVAAHVEPASDSGFGPTKISLNERLDAVYERAIMPAPLEAAEPFHTAVHALVCELVEEVAVGIDAAHRRWRSGSGRRGSRSASPPPVLQQDASPSGRGGTAIHVVDEHEDAADAPPEGADADAAAESPPPPAHDAAADGAAHERAADAPAAADEGEQAAEADGSSAAPSGPRVDVDWVGTRALDLPAAALSWARSQPEPEESRAPHKSRRSITSAASVRSMASSHHSGQAEQPMAYIIPTPFSPPPSPRPDALAHSSPWEPVLRPGAADAGGFLSANEEAYRKEVHETVRGLLLALADKITLQGPELNPLSTEMVPVVPTAWQEQAAFAAEWQSTKERVAEDLREHAMLRRGLHMALTIKPTKKRK